MVSVVVTGGRRKSDLQICPRRSTTWIPNGPGRWPGCTRSINQRLRVFKKLRPKLFPLCFCVHFFNFVASTRTESFRAPGRTETTNCTAVWCVGFSRGSTPTTERVFRRLGEAHSGFLSWFQLARNPTWSVQPIHSSEAPERFRRRPPWSLIWNSGSAEDQPPDLEGLLSATDGHRSKSVGRFAPWYRRRAAALPRSPSWLDSVGLAAAGAGAALRSFLAPGLAAARSVLASCCAPPVLAAASVHAALVSRRRCCGPASVHADLRPPEALTGPPPRSWP